MKLGLLKHEFDIFEENVSRKAPPIPQTSHTHVSSNSLVTASCFAPSYGINKPHTGHRISVTNIQRIMMQGVEVYGSANFSARQISLNRNSAIGAGRKDVRFQASLLNTCLQQSFHSLLVGFTRKKRTWLWRHTEYIKFWKFSWILDTFTRWY